MKRHELTGRFFFAPVKHLVLVALLVHVLVASPILLARNALKALHPVGRKCFKSVAVRMLILPHIFVWGSFFWFCIQLSVRRCPSASRTRTCTRTRIHTHTHNCLPHNSFTRNFVTHNFFSPFCFTHNSPTQLFRTRRQLCHAKLFTHNSFTQLRRTELCVAGVACGDIHAALRVAGVVLMWQWVWWCAWSPLLSCEAPAAWHLLHRLPFRAKLNHPHASLSQHFHTQPSTQLCHSQLCRIFVTLNSFTQNFITPNSFTHSAFTYNALRLSILYHVLCPFCLLRSASTTVSDYFKKLTCGLIRAFTCLVHCFWSLSLHPSRVVLCIC